MAPNHSAEELPSVSKHKKAVMWCAFQKNTLEKYIRSGMCCHAAAYEFNISESTIYIT